MKRLLIGLDKLNGTEVANDTLTDYRKIQIGVANYLKDNDYFTDDELRNKLLYEGVTYSLYSKTGFPKNNGVKLQGLPYDLRQNADICKRVYRITEELNEAVEEAYKREEAKIIDDIDEETISDEPIIKEEPIKETPIVSPFYQTYLDTQNEYPDAIVVQRVGDFYEVMGENAKLVSSQLDLTLTGRNVGLPERVPMVGFPFHVRDKYIDNIRKENAVVVIEPDKEPEYLISFKELFAGEVKTDEELEEEQDENEKAAELQGRQYVREEPDNKEDEEEYIDLDELEEVADDRQPQEKSKGKPIQERKRKNNSQQQFSLFDMMGDSSEQEESLNEKLIRHELKRGSGFERGKMRICHEYAKTQQ